MAVSRTPAGTDPGLAAHTLDRTTIWPPRPPVPVPFTGQATWARVIRQARCADGSLDPDQWFPVNVEADQARREAAAAIAVCASCLVRAQCLALSLQHWDIGQHGIWGGLVAADRAALRRRRHPSMIRKAPRALTSEDADPGVAEHSSPGDRSRQRREEHMLTARPAVMAMASEAPGIAGSKTPRTR
jgi:Transcription factor WhiB